MNFKNLLSLLTVLVFGLTLGACEKKADDHGEHSEHGEHGEHGHEHGEKAHADGEEHAHAPKGYEPGSHEDWCGEHQVPESMCTRCNPSLVPAFKAKDDWCEEHKMPKSQCLACDPDLVIERPPKKEGK
tara:strand:- start:53 stop:439 length:387 start_codon:yes stop_codon:yes gene_type:complete